uniref:Battenin n=1 Tax=Loa loa TaxID=7209 RepID=A0A1I7W0E6_LOALO
MLSAAEDILEQGHQNTMDVERKCLDKINSRRCIITTTGAVLLADILPCLVVKLTFPFFMQRVPFGMRHFIICLLQSLSYLIVAFSSSVVMSLTGVVFASVSSGLGEITYLSLTPYFTKNTISTWSSGTGGAGIIGALTYAVLTEPHFLNLSPKISLLIMLVVPLMFSLAYWCLLILPDSIHRVNIMEPSTWIVPKTCLSETSSNGISNMETEDDKNSSMSSKQVKQRILSFEEMLLVTLVLYQTGVFISRSSVNILQLPYWALVLLPMLQKN